MYGTNKKIYLKLTNSKYEIFSLEYKSRLKTFPHSKRVPCFLN
jgi:hypothetical protein